MSKQEPTADAKAAAAVAAAGGPAPAPLGGVLLAAAASPLHQGAAPAGQLVLPPRTPARGRLSLKEQAAKAAAERHTEALPPVEPSPSRSRPATTKQQAQPSPYTAEYEYQPEGEVAPYTGQYAFDQCDSDSDIDLTGTPAGSQRPRSKRRAAGPAAPAAMGGWTEDGWFVPPPATSAPPSRKRRTSGRADMPPLTRFLSPSKAPSG